MTKIILIILLFILLLIVLFPKIIKREILSAFKKITLKLLKYFLKSKAPQKTKDNRREGEVTIEKRPGASRKNNSPSNSDEYIDFEEIK